MPYIDKGGREMIDPDLGPILDLIHADNGQTLQQGELNYIITKIIDKWTSSRGLSYATINEVVGVLNCVVAEYYRRVAVPYEKRKADSNGDVYSTEIARR